MEAKPRHLRALTNWTALNDFLRTTTKVDDLRILEKLEARRSPQPRKMFVERISGRKRVAELVAERRGKR